MARTSFILDLSLSAPPRSHKHWLDGHPSLPHAEVSPTGFGFFQAAHDAAHLIASEHQSSLLPIFRDEAPSVFRPLAVEDEHTGLLSVYDAGKEHLKSAPAACLNCSAKNVRKDSRHLFCIECGWPLPVKSRFAIRIKKKTDLGICLVKVSGLDGDVGAAVMLRQKRAILAIANNICGPYGIFVKYTLGGKLLLVSGLADANTAQFNLRVMLAMLSQLQSALINLRDSIPVLQGLSLLLTAATGSGSLASGRHGVRDPRFDVTGNDVNVTARCFGAGSKLIESHGSVAGADTMKIVLTARAAEVVQDVLVTPVLGTAIYKGLEALGPQKIHVIDPAQMEKMTGEVAPLDRVVHFGCAQQDLHANLGARHCAECGTSAPLTDTQDLEQTDFCVVVAADMSGYTYFSSTHDDREVARVFRETVIGVVEREITLAGGKNIGRNGDQVIAVFPIALRERAIRACVSAAQKLKRLRVREGELPVQVKFALAEGEVCYDQTLIAGKVIEEADAAMAMAGADGLVLHPSIDRQSLAFVSTIEVPGQQDHLLITGLTSDAPFLTRPQSVPNERVEDARYFQKQYELMLASRQPRAVAFVGPEGVGKIQSLSLFLNNIHLPDVYLLYGAATRYQSDPLREALRRHLTMPGDDELTMTGLRGGLQSLLSIDSVYTYTAVALMANYLGVKDAPLGPELAQLVRDPERYMRERRRIISGVVRALADIKPMLLVFFNINQMDDETRDILRELIAPVESSFPLFIIGFADTTIPEAQNFSWTAFLSTAAKNSQQRGGDNRDVLVAEPFTAESFKQIILHIFNQQIDPHSENPLQPQQVSDELVHRYLKRSENNLENLRVIMAYDFQQGYLLRNAEGRLQLSDPPEGFARLDALLVSPLDDLPAPARDIYQVVALLTRFDDQFSLRDLPQSAQSDPFLFVQTVADLERAHLIAATGNGVYRVSNRRTAAALYRQLCPPDSPDVERSRHARIARHLGLKEPDTTRAYAMLGYHLLMSGEAVSAYDNFVQAISLARAAYQLDEALRYLDYLEQCLPAFVDLEKLYRQRDIILQRIAIYRSRTMQQQWEQAIGQLEALQHVPAITFFKQDERDQLDFEVIIQRGILGRYFAPSEAAAYFDKIALTVGHFIDQLPWKDQIRFHLTAASLYAMAQQYSKVREHLKPEYVDVGVGDDALTASAALNLATYYIRIGDFDAAERYIKIAQTLYERMGDRENYCYSRILEANYLQGKNRYREVLDILAAVDTEASARQFPIAQAYALINWGIALMKLGDKTARDRFSELLIVATAMRPKDAGPKQDTKLMRQAKCYSAIFLGFFDPSNALKYAEETLFPTFEISLVDQEVAADKVTNQVLPILALYLAALNAGMTPQILNLRARLRTVRERIGYVEDFDEVIQLILLIDIPDQLALVAQFTGNK